MRETNLSEIREKPELVKETDLILEKNYEKMLKLISVLKKNIDSYNEQLLGDINSLDKNKALLHAEAILNNYSALLSLAGINKDQEAEMVNKYDLIKNIDTLIEADDPILVGDEIMDYLQKMMRVEVLNAEKDILNNEYSNMYSVIVDFGKKIVDLNALATELNRKNSEQELGLGIKDKIIEEQGKELDEKNKALNKKDGELEEKDKELDEKNKSLSKKDDELDEKDKVVEERNKALSGRNIIIENLTDENKSKAKDILDLNSRLSDQAKQTTVSDELKIKWDNEKAELQKEIRSLEKEIERLSEELKSYLVNLNLLKAFKNSSESENIELKEAIYGLKIDEKLKNGLQTIYEYIVELKTERAKKEILQEELDKKNKRQALIEAFSKKTTNMILNLPIHRLKKRETPNNIDDLED